MRNIIKKYNEIGMEYSPLTGPVEAVLLLVSRNNIYFSETD